MGNFAELVKEKLQKRSTEQLKNDVKAAMDSEEYGSNVCFVAALSILETRLSKEEYEQFEASL